MSQGWKCPNCGKAHAPHVLTCPEPAAGGGLSWGGILDILGSPAEAVTMHDGPDYTGPWPVTIGDLSGSVKAFTLSGATGRTVC